MGDRLETISIEHLNRAVSSAVNLARLADLSTSISRIASSVGNASLPMATSRTTSKASRSSGTTTAAPIRPATRTDAQDSLMTTRVTGGTFSTTTVSGSVLRAAMTPNNGQKAIMSTLQETSGSSSMSRAGSFNQQRHSLPSLPLVPPTPSPLPAQPAMYQSSSSTQRTSVGTIPHKIVTSEGKPVQDNPMLSSVRPAAAKSIPVAPLSKPAEGMVIQVQVPVVQTLPTGAQIVSSLLPHSASNDTLFTPMDVAVDGRMVRLVPVSSVGSTVTGTSSVNLVEPVKVMPSSSHTNTMQPLQLLNTLTSGLFTASQSVTVPPTSGPAKSHSLNISSDVPDLLAVATQTAVPHLVTQYSRSTTLPVTGPTQADLSSGSSTSTASKFSRPAAKIVPTHICSGGGQPEAAVMLPQAVAVTTPHTNSLLAVTGAVAGPPPSLPTTSPTTSTTASVNLVMTDVKTTGGGEVFLTSFSNLPTVSSGSLVPGVKESRQRPTIRTLLLRSMEGILETTTERSAVPAQTEAPFKGHCFCGVEAVETISAKTKFGPLVGIKKKATEADLSPQSVHMWKIFSSPTEYELLDCMDENESNWMRFVRTACTVHEHNITAYQEDGLIYMVAVRDIAPSTELRYWFSTDYAQCLGKPTTPGESFSCTSCHKFFSSVGALNRHTRYSHGAGSQARMGSKRRLKCDFCERSFSTSSKRHTHMLGHRGVKPHRCTHCGKAFSDQSNLRMHLLIHSDVRQFVCPTCNRAFKQKAHLSSHLLTHTGEKTVPCRFCGKLFARPSDMRQHELQHTRERIYHCNYPDCNKIFYKLQNLKKHEKVHTGLREFTCQSCQKSFATTYHLKRHFNKVHREEQEAGESSASNAVQVADGAADVVSDMGCNMNVNT